MKIIQLNADPKTLYQAIEATVLIKNRQVRVRFELRFLEMLNKWFLSMFDSQTNKSYFRYVPVVFCKTSVNNLVAPFHYKGLGIVVCASELDNPTTENPEKDNMNEFVLVWGDEGA